MPRLLTVLFPLFMALAVIAERRRVTRHVIAGSALLGAFLTATLATWHVVASSVYPRLETAKGDPCT